MSPPVKAFTRSLALLGAMTTLAIALTSLTPCIAGARQLVTGVSGVYDQGGFQQSKETGARFVRIAIDWERIAPNPAPASWNPANPADPNYNWRRADDAVSEAVAAGLTPLAIIEGAPAWAQRCTPPPIQAFDLCDPDPSALAAFARAAAIRYGGEFAGLPHVRYWQGLNEPNLSLYFFPQFEGGKPISPALYRELINAFYFAIKQVDHSNLVVTAGLGPIAVPRWTMGPMRFTRELLCMRGHNHPKPTRGNCGGGVHFDIFAIHPYTTGGPTHEGGVNDVQLGDLAKLRKLLVAADRAGRIKGQFKHTPLWVTEFSWDTNPPDPGGLPMKIASRWLAEALHRAWRAGVKAFFWFGLRDFARPPGQPYSQTLESGLYFRGSTIAQDKPKEVLFAFKFPFVAYPTKRGLTLWGRTPTSTRGKVAIQLWRAGRWRRAKVVRANRAGIFRARLHTGYGRGKRGSARAVYQGQGSVPFSMRPVKDFRQNPFG